MLIKHTICELKTVNGYFITNYQK